MAAMSGGQSLLHLGDDMQSPDVLCLLMNFLKCDHEAQNLTALKKRLTLVSRSLAVVTGLKPKLSSSAATAGRVKNSQHLTS